MTAPALEPRPTPRVAASLPRDMLLRSLAKHEPRLDRALVRAPRPRWIRTRDQIRVTLYFSVDELLAERASSRPGPAS